MDEIFRVRAVLFDHTVRGALSLPHIEIALNVAFVPRWGGLFPTPQGRWDRQLRNMSETDI
jgi:hypothetical protein